MRRSLRLAAQLFASLLSRAMESDLHLKACVNSGAVIVTRHFEASQ
jgi:hypothetical protein